MDLEELDLYRAYCTAGGDPKKFKWTSPDHAGTRRPMGIADEVFQFAEKAFGRVPSPKKDWLHEYAKVHGVKKILQLSDGTYVDESGQPVELPPGAQLVPTS